MNELEPETDDLMTIADKVRIPRWLYRAVVPESDAMKLFWIIFGGLIVAAIWAEWDYAGCKARNPDCTFIECTSHNEPPPMRRHK